jgi:hypothetical protein
MGCFLRCETAVHGGETWDGGAGSVENDEAGRDTGELAGGVTARKEDNRRGRGSETG